MVAALREEPQMQLGCALGVPLALQVPPSPPPSAPKVPAPINGEDPQSVPPPLILPVAQQAGVSTAGEPGELLAASAPADAASCCSQPLAVPAGSPLEIAASPKGIGVPESMKLSIPALAKKPPQKSYLPTFAAPEAYGKKKGESSFARIAAEVEQKMTRIAAEKEKAKRRRLTKRHPVAQDESPSVTDEESEACWTLVFTVTLGVLLALAEALDLDVLVGILMMPFMAVMRYFADEFQNESLDPALWIAKVAKGSRHFAEVHPAWFVAVDFGVFAVISLLILFAADLSKWWAMRRMHSQGYAQLDDDGARPTARRSRFGALSKVIKDPEAMQQMLRKATEELEEVDFMLRLRGEAESDVKAALSTRRVSIESSISTLNEFLAAVVTQKAASVDLESLAREAAEAEAKKKREGGCSDVTKMFVTVVKNSIAGFLTIWLYFMDLISDYQVTVLFYSAGALRFAAVSAFLLVGQFAVVWMRVLPYLHVTYGAESTFYRSFLYLGMPLGMFFFDFLMFLEPFGLLPFAPLPENLRQFIPAYKATRIIAEVAVEALPQCIMQAIILVLVSNHVRDGTASEVEVALTTLKGGAFVSLLPKSVLISSLTMLKTWYELVQEAREAGISVGKKGMQLWNVGYGLPLDAIKKGSIYGWMCQYEISDQEVVSLIDALTKNESLTRLDLSLAGLEWRPPIGREERSAFPLIEAVNQNPKSLEALETLVICQSTRWEIPVQALRSGPERALKTLNEMQLLSKGGPDRDEMSAIFELLCKNRSTEPGESELELSYTAATKVFTDSLKPGVNAKAKRAAWQLSVSQLITKGMTRRSHFKVVVSAEVLRNIGFSVQELIDISFIPEELKAGGFEARELWKAGFEAGALKKLGYAPKDMSEAEVPAQEMKKLGYSARELHDGGFTAQQLKGAQFTLIELKEGRYKAAELGDAGFHIPELRAANFTAFDLRKALIFTVQMMRDAGYTATEMRKAGYEAKRVQEAGYNESEATEAGFTVPQMHAAGYGALGLRKAGHTALVLREAGYDLNDLQGAFYTADELGDAGYSAQELKEAGTSLVQLKAADTPMATLKDAGYTAARLKQQGYTATELATGARGKIDFTSHAVGQDEGGYNAKELRAGGVSAHELRKGKVFFVVDEFKNGAWTTRELKEGGFTAADMKLCGYVAAELRKTGFSVQDLVHGGFPIAELRAVGATASELRDAYVSAKQLSEVGYSAKELLVAGFSAKELIACGFGVPALREAGFDAIQLRQLGFTSKELKAYGYGAASLKEAGSVVKELKELGFSNDELLGAGFAERAVAAVDGSTVQDLREIGNYSVTELRQYGYVVADLRGIYRVKEMKDEGFSLRELKEGGVPEHAVFAVNGRSTRALRAAKYSAQILRKIGFALYELVEGGYTATELKEARYGAEELKEVGVTAGALREAGFTSKELHAARYGLREMQEGGYLWKDLVIFLRATHADLTRAGYKDLDPKHELFLLYRSKDEVEDDVNIHDLSILSPRYHRSSPAPATGPRIMEVTARCLKVRRSVALTSKRMCNLKEGTRVRVLDSRVWRDGTQRVCVAAADADQANHTPQQVPFGWVSSAPGFLTPRAETQRSAMQFSSPFEC